MSCQAVAHAVPAFSSSGLRRRSLLRRGVEAAIWGMPLVSVDAMRQAFLRDAHAQYGDILYFSKGATWRFQTTTPNPSSLHVYFNVNLKDGPVVVELPASDGAALSGTIIDAWETPLVDVGSEGDDRGRGAKYLLLPPGDGRSAVGRFTSVRSRTNNAYALLRAIPSSTSREDTANALALVKKMRVYPLWQAASPPAPRHIDIAGILFDGIVRFDDSFYDSLARMVNEEPVLRRDLVAMAQLRSLGIEKGRPFRPDQLTRNILKEAIAEVHSHLMHAVSIGGPYWPGSQWILSTVVGPTTGYTYETADRLDIDERGVMFYLSYAVPKTPGAGAFYLGAYRDHLGAPLRGDERYRVRIPAWVPARQSWAVTAYDLATAAFIRDAPRLSVDSADRLVRRNPDDSIDVWFGPTAPTGHERNWIYTAPGKPWFSFVRFFGPEPALFHKTWVLPNIERLP
jgi:hypothetical protein